MFSERPTLSDKYYEALKDAGISHQYQMRKFNNAPYICHLLAVSATVLEHGGGEELAIAALFHDYLEDIPGADIIPIRNKYGDNVADVVLSLTEDKTIADKVKRKANYAKSIDRAGYEACFVKAADILHNARSFAREGMLKAKLPQIEVFLPALERHLGEEHSLLKELMGVLKEFALELAA